MFVNSSLESEHVHFTVCYLMGMVYNMTKMLLLVPLSVLVLYHGYRRWRQQRSFKTMTHTDVFTYHLAAVELIGLLGTVLFCCGYYSDLPNLVTAGYYLTSCVFYGETFFHILTCGERYLAVVHPITYLGLRNPRGVRIRNFSIGCAWLTCFIWSSVLTRLFSLATIPFFCMLICSLVAISFFSLSVLCVLIRPGPGEGGGDGERVDQSKQRAFLTVMAITVMLWLWFLGFLVTTALGTSEQLSPSASCVMMSSGFWFNLPSSLVLPLLYLHRTGQLSW